MSKADEGGLLGWLFGGRKKPEATKSVIATWGDILHAPPQDFKLNYEEAGGIHPWGDVNLYLDHEGKARLENQIVNVRTVWTGRVEAATLKRLLDALHDGNFPQVLPVPEELFVAGAAVARLRIDASGKSGIAEIELQTGNHDPSCQIAVHLLESLAFQLSDGFLKQCKNTQLPVVSDVKKLG